MASGQGYQDRDTKEMVLMQVSPDRWQAHREIAARFAKSSEYRGHLWRFMGEGEALVQSDDDPLVIPDRGEEISFRIDCVPVKKCRGRRQLFPLTEQFMEDWFLNRLGLAIDIENITTRVMSFSVQKNTGERFTRPSARFIGSGRVLDRDLLERHLRHGIGDAKAYGFGLLEIKKD